MGADPVPVDSEMATIVTTLEMRKRPPARPCPSLPPSAGAWIEPAPDKYRALFRRVGAPWLWFSRLVMDEARYRESSTIPVAIYAASIRRASRSACSNSISGQPRDCEISYFGLVPELAGKAMAAG
jgi:hypothetical protein